MANSTRTMTVTEETPSETSPNKSFDFKSIVWRNVIACSGAHLAAIYGIYLGCVSAKWQTNLFGLLLYIISGLGITAGAHRLWAHRAYKAKLPLRLFLGFLNTVAFQNHIYEWCRDHRVHHKFSETDADPHNSNRGFFFAHVGWLLIPKHPDVIRKGKTVDFSDLLADPIVSFQRKFFLPLALFCCFVLPTWFCQYFWNETLVNALCIAGFLRYCICLNCTFLVNSAAHMWGTRPYNLQISPRENLFVSLGAIGEGYHNYHHSFPWDYSTSELGMKLNLTTKFIDAMEFIGQAYDLKTASAESIINKKRCTGDH